ncbi:MAG: hypothetical protein WAP51_01795 [Candidatus Sungiibacteriota bacterium]
MSPVRNRGVFIALEGTDGTGKKTQKDLLLKRLKKDGYKVAEISFPQYGKPSAWQIEQYLNGFFGKPDAVDPYFSSLLFAADRREAKPTIEQWLKEYDVVISDRYAASNAGHQGGKITDPKKRKRYLEWLWKTEFEVNKIPIPDLNVVLYVTPSVSQKNILKKASRSYLKKGSRRDGHERDLAHLKRAAASYRWLVKQNPKHFRLTNCMKGAHLASPEEIHEKIWTLVRPLLKKSR